MKLIVFADVHEQIEAVEEIVRKEKCADFVLSLGDLRNDRNFDFPADYGYRDYGIPTYFIKGNHEVWEKITALQSGRLIIPNLHIIKPGQVVRLKTEDSASLLRVAGLGGNYSEKFYECPRDKAPINTFINEEVENSKTVGADIFLSHECSVSLELTKCGRNVGVSAIDEIIASIKPKIALSGHHHTYKENKIMVDGKEVLLVGLESPADSYLVLNYDGCGITLERKTLSMTYASQI